MLDGRFWLLVCRRRHGVSGGSGSFGAFFSFSPSAYLSFVDASCTRLAVAWHFAAKLGFCASSAAFVHRCRVVESRRWFRDFGNFLEAGEGEDKGIRASHLFGFFPIVSKQCLIVALFQDANWLLVLLYNAVILLLIGSPGSSGSFGSLVGLIRIVFLNPRSPETPISLHRTASKIHI